MTNINPLWPYSTRLALLAIPVIWVLSAITLGLTHNYLAWPDSGTINNLTLIVIAFGFIPLALVLLDTALNSRAKVEFMGVKIDFSRVDLAQPEVRYESIGIPDNAGDEGELVTDSSPMQITNALEKATQNEIVQIDLKEGASWWTTRLLALSAGAVRAGAPKILVFTGTKANVSQVFLGWATPKDILRALLNNKLLYKDIYQKSVQISKQVSMYGLNQYLPMAKTIQISLHQDIERYIYSEQYAQLGDAVFEQILMDQLALNCEQPPDKLSISRFEELFIHCSYLDIVDLEWSKDIQMRKLLDSQAPYLALVRNYRYEAMIKQEAGERIILKQLFLQSQEAVSMDK